MASRRPMKHPGATRIPSSIADSTATMKPPEIGLGSVCAVGKADRGSKLSDPSPKSYMEWRVSALASQYWRVSGFRMAWPIRAATSAWCETP